MKTKEFRGKTYEVSAKIEVGDTVIGLDQDGEFEEWVKGRVVSMDDHAVRINEGQPSDACSWREDCFKVVREL